MYQTMDNIDGKQARRTGQSSGLGELFDHGIDSLNCTLASLCETAAIGLGPTPKGVFTALIPCLPMFFSTWETYHTHTLYLGVLQWTNRRSTNCLHHNDLLWDSWARHVAYASRRHSRLLRIPRHNLCRRHLDSHTPGIPLPRPPSRMHLQRVPCPQTPEASFPPCFPRVDPNGHLHGLHWPMAVQSSLDLDGGQPSHAILSDDEFRVRKNDNQNDLSAFDKATVFHIGL